MAKKRPVTVWHVFKDGTVTQDPSGHPVPADIIRQVAAIADRVERRIAREAALAAHNTKE